MKKILIIFAIIIVINISPGAKVYAAAEDVTSFTEYSSVIDDLPLMTDMGENIDEAVVFDKPAGRIVESIAHVNANSGEIKKFYKKNLPPLGWKYVSSLTFLRDNETLEIKIDGKDDNKTVHFILTPNSK